MNSLADGTTKKTPQLSNRSLQLLPTSFQLNRLHVQNWKISAAFHPEDIDWRRMRLDPIQAFFHLLIANIVIFVCSFVLITPLSVYSVVRPIKDELENSGTIMANVGNLFSPLIIALVNVGIIPFLVDFYSFFQISRTKSEIQKNILNMNIFYMTLNMIILPLTGLISFEEILLLAKSDKIMIVDILGVLSSNLGNMASFFVTYIMQVTFLSNCIQLFDIPHFLWKNMFSFLYWLKQKPYEDDWFYQLGYYWAFTFTIMNMSLLFSVAMPIVSIFAFVFFFFRYLIEKYNFLYVYQQEYESANLLQHVSILQIVTVIFFQIINFTYISVLADDKRFQFFGVIFIILQILTLLGLKMLRKKNPKLFRRIVFMDESYRNQ